MRRADGHPAGGMGLGGLLVAALGVAALVIVPGSVAAGARTATPVHGSPVRDSAPPPPPGPGGGFSEDGHNWSGYVVSGREFRSVSGRWTEPAVTCTSTDQAFAPWVGIDGYGGSTTVEQTGVATVCSSGRPVYRAWYETVPEPPDYYPLPVRAGDVITAEVTRTGSSYAMTISDVTRGWSRRTVRTHPGTNVSAEVALEAQPGGFPRFGSVSFTGATVDGKPLASAGPSAIDATDSAGALTATGPLSGGDFTVRDRHG